MAYTPAGTYYWAVNTPTTIPFQGYDGPWGFQSTKPSDNTVDGYTGSHDLAAQDDKVYIRPIKTNSALETIQTGSWVASTAIGYRTEHSQWQERAFVIPVAGFSVGASEHFGFEVRPSLGTDVDMGGLSVGLPPDNRFLFSAGDIPATSITVYASCEYSDNGGDEPLWVAFAWGFSAGLGFHTPNLPRVVVSGGGTDLKDIIGNGWNYDSALTPSQFANALNGNDAVDISGVVTVSTGAVTITNTALVVTGTTPNATISHSTNSVSLFAVRGGAWSGIFFNTNYAVDLVGTAARSFTNCRFAKAFLGYGIENVTMTDCVLDIGSQHSGNFARWCGSNNTFTRVISMNPLSKTAFGDTFPSTQYKKSMTGNRFIECEATAYEEIYGYDSLPVSIGLALAQVTTKNGDDVTLTVLHDYTGWGQSVGMHVVPITGDSARDYFPITNKVGSTLTLGDSRYCKSRDLIAVGDWVFVGPIHADNDYIDCKAFVQYERKTNQPANDNGLEFGNTAWSLFGMCHGNLIQGCSTPRLPSETVPISELSCNNFTPNASGRPTAAVGEAGAFIFLNSVDQPYDVWNMAICSHNRIIGNDFSGVTTVYGSSSLLDDTWSVETDQPYDSHNPPYVGEIGHYVYGGKSHFIDNIYDPAPQGIFTRIDSGYGQFNSPPIKKVQLHDVKDIVWRGNSGPPDIRYSCSGFLRWFPDDGWNTTPAISETFGIWGEGIDGSTGNANGYIYEGGESGTTWSMAAPGEIFATVVTGGVEIVWGGTATDLQRSDAGGTYASLEAPYTSPYLDTQAQGSVQYRALIDGEWVYSEVVYVLTTYDIAPYIRDDIVVEVPLLTMALSAYSPSVSTTIAPRTYDIAPYIIDAIYVDVPRLNLVLTGYSPSITSQRNVAIAAPRQALVISMHPPYVNESTNQLLPLFMGAGF
jgi:hypothetical protein